LSDGFGERLRDRFVSPPQGAEVLPDCPDADRIQAAARGEASFADVEALLDHVSGCAACTVAWRFAREAAPPVRRADVRWLAAAAMVIVALVGGKGKRTLA
jgi:hypothetical protein